MTMQASFHSRALTPLPLAPQATVEARVQATASGTGGAGPGRAAQGSSRESSVGSASANAAATARPIPRAPSGGRGRQRGSPSGVASRLLGVPEGSPGS